MHSSSLASGPISREIIPLVTPMMRWPMRWLIISSPPLGPSAGEEMISQRIGQRIIGVTSGIISRLMGPDASDEECILRSMTLTGQLLPFHLTRTSSLKSLGWDALTPERYAMLMGIVREQTVTLLRGLGGSGLARDGINAV